MTKENTNLIDVDKTACDDLNPNWEPGDPIGYINPNVPNVSPPAYNGDHYEALVPDTFDLAERARLVINPLTEATDPKADYENYFMGVFYVKPPLMCHGVSDANTHPKFQIAVPLMRIISGSRQNLHVEAKWMERTLKCIGQDGLLYMPLKGRPWEANAIPNWIRTGVDNDQYINPFATGMTLAAMTVMARRDSSDLWNNAVRKMVDSLTDLAVESGDIAYFWPGAFQAVKNAPSNVKPPVTEENGEACRVPYGLVHAYRLLGYEPAITLAGKNLKYLKKYFFDEDGCFLRTPDDPMTVHFHEHSRAILTMLEYAVCAGNDEMMDFALKSFEWAKNLGVHPKGLSSSCWQPGGPGGPLVGYFPEFVNSVQWHASELCNVADMIAVAIRFSELGLGDYWDDADRWIRNMFAEGQLQTIDWIYRITEADAYNPPPVELLPTESIVGPYCTAERVPERNLGAFAGYPAVNDWYVRYGIGIMQCCTVTSALTLYQIWKSVLKYDSGNLRINLLFNHASMFADIGSYIPYQGRVEIKIKETVDLSIRIPEWVQSRQTCCEVNGKGRDLEWDGRYALIGSVKPADKVTLTFPIFERTDVVYVEKHRYVLTRKGNDVVEIDPPGRYCPLYQRRHYRDNEPRLRKVTRFISNENIDW